MIILSISMVISADDDDEIRTTTKKPVNPTKEIILCEITEFMDDVSSNCKLNAINFTFYAYFSFKRSKRLAISTLEELSKTLSNYSTCDINYLKYNFWGEHLDYMNSSEEITLQDPDFQNSNKANVYIISDGAKTYRKTIIYECILPKSDVYLSLKPIASRFSQSRPIGLNKVTVSGFHVKLNFMPLSGIDVNVKTSAKSAQKYLVFYHYKCRNCFVDINPTTINENDLLDPFSYRSIRCQLRPKSCVYDGKCYYDDEKIDSSNPDSDYACNHPIDVPLPPDFYD
ncbi:unnamed protein product [Brachionus calyciflorus]|uniref:Uncharacterized protein n=1 Tax=Brachionus calyciflorus TaxID=104777 RepID=A0A813WML8_9BILA|nr:unnamed protein product [Brachionus calyciflorus]